GPGCPSRDCTGRGRRPSHALELLSGLEQDTLEIGWPLNPGAAERSEQIRRGRPPQEVAVSHAGVRDENVITGFVNTEGEGRQIWRGDLAFARGLARTKVGLTPIKQQQVGVLPAEFTAGIFAVGKGACTGAAGPGRQGAPDFLVSL